MLQHIRCKSAVSAHPLAAFFLLVAASNRVVCAARLLETGQKSQAQARSIEFGLRFYMQSHEKELPCEATRELLKK